jgi:hypothetical protein
MPPEPDIPYDPVPVVRALSDAGVDFVVIGGVAGGFHGSSYGTEDIDLAYSRERANLERLADALRALDARLRGAPDDVPFQLDAATLEAGGNFTFTTSLGSVDILAYPAGAPSYERLRDAAAVGNFAGHAVRFASLDHLIAMKEAAGRPRDKLMASEYRTIADERRRER